MLEADVRIVAINEDNRFDVDTGDRKAIVRVTFKVGSHGPFVERFDKATYTADVRDDKLNAFAREVRTT
jgi:hypothetical protein